MQDDQIIELYIDRDEQAIIETESKYGCYCMDLAFRMRLLPAAAVYSAVKRLPELPHRVKSAITVLGGCTFGVYLIEQILRERLYPLCDRLHKIIPPPAGTMIYAVLVFFFCIPFVWTVKRISVFKRLI